MVDYDLSAHVLLNGGMRLREFVPDDSKDDLDDGLDYFEDDLESDEEKAPAKATEAPAEGATTEEPAGKPTEDPTQAPTEQPAQVNSLTCVTPSGSIGDTCLFNMTTTSNVTQVALCDAEGSRITSTVTKALSEGDDLRIK